MINFWNKISSKAISLFDLNEAALSGGVDVIVVRQKDGSLKSTPFHVRFGKFHILKSKGQPVKIEVNNRPTSIVMKLGASGEGYFEEIPDEVEAGRDLPEIPINDQSIIFGKNNHENIQKISSEILLKENQGTSYLKLPDDDEENVLVLNEEVTSTRFKDLKNENIREQINGIDERQIERDQKLLKTLNGNNENHSVKVQRLIYPGSNNNPKKVKLAEFIQTKIEQGKHLSEKIRSSIERGFHSDDPEESESIDKKDIETGKKIIKFISDGAQYELLLQEKNNFNPNNLKNSNMFVPISFSEITQDPQKFLNNENLLIKIHGVKYNNKITKYVISNLLKNTQVEGLNESTTEIYDYLEDEEEFDGLESWGKYSSRSPKPNMLSSISTKAKSSSHVSIESSQRSNKPQRSRKTFKNKKTLRLNSDALKSLNLKPGVNKITYTVHSSLQGTHKISANIYLWEPNTKIIVTDIDGTVTKSDVLGAILPMIGKDWSQPGIVPLFSNIKRNGYQIIYLTTRAIGQIGFTRSFVNTLQQDGVKLPMGPIISSPDRLLTCVRREMIISKPEYYKAGALRDIKNLFPSGINPFYAAFGNRENDAVAYRFVGIPLENIFTVNQNGEIHHSKALIKSYPMMNSQMKQLFPCQP